MVLKGLNKYQINHKNPERPVATPCEENQQNLFYFFKNWQQHFHFEDKLLLNPKQLNQNKSSGGVGGGGPNPITRWSLE